MFVFEHNFNFTPVRIHKLKKKKSLFWHVKCGRNKQHMFSVFNATLLKRAFWLSSDLKMNFFDLIDKKKTV